MQGNDSTVSATNFILSIMKLVIVDIFDRHRILLVTIAGIVTELAGLIIFSSSSSYASWFIASPFLSIMKGITSNGKFGFYVAICFFGWVFVVFYVPEAGACSSKIFERSSIMALKENKALAKANAGSLQGFNH
ncbi:hypothetical protein SNOG_03848 [Parastagonospora nodorum SN15]|uniref:Major facilitator superfamily (MFS) profile domain-containing protein n=1 Tax=Phaeosphaeria nodorum (strain SN15 / ATCC MYA-4574 / FGSC 10173) TaxID=321614 RepID=Q0UWL6_PHANO|nr:hypothetical protein SNOG_03848 [Parastagonospora nodorum SN15]EAT89053.1 hypothetical protein SNOG_03848 [Parastagonospora nodorum SN15]